MNARWRASLRGLRRSLLLAGAMITVSVALVVGSSWMRTSSDESLAQARHALSTAEQQLRNVREENQSLERSLVENRSLRQRGVIGQPRRLDWTELLIAAGQPLADFQYRFSPTQNEPAPPPADGSAALYQTLVTPLDLQATLRQELELVDLLRKLRATGQIARPRQCRMEQQLAPEARGAITVACTVDWINIAPASEPGAQGQGS